MDEEKKTKWKCRSCEKILASKQNALKHVQKFHEEKSPTETIVKVKVTNVEKQPKPVPKLKRKHMLSVLSFTVYLMMQIWLKSFPGASGKNQTIVNRSLQDVAHKVQLPTQGQMA